MRYAKCAILYALCAIHTKGTMLGCFFSMRWLENNEPDGCNLWRPIRGASGAAFLSRRPLRQDRRPLLAAQGDRWIDASGAQRR